MARSFRPLAFALALSLPGAFLWGAHPSAAAEDDRAVAEVVLRELGGVAPPADAGARDASLENRASTENGVAPGQAQAGVAELVERAKAALTRADQLRASGDAARARLAEGLARDLAETGRDLVAAATAERRAYDARRNALDAGAALERERALLEENVARVGRLRAQLEALDGGPLPSAAPSPPRGDAPRDAGAAKTGASNGTTATPKKGTP